MGPTRSSGASPAGTHGVSLSRAPACGLCSELEVGTVGCGWLAVPLGGPDTVIDAGAEWEERPQARPLDTGTSAVHEAGRPERSHGSGNHEHLCSETEGKREQVPRMRGEIGRK